MGHSRLILVAALGLLVLAGPAGGHAAGPRRATRERIRIAPGLVPGADYSLRMDAGVLYVAYWAKAADGKMTLRLDTWRLNPRPAELSAGLVLLTRRVPSHGLYSWALLYGPQAGRLLLDATPTVNRVWVIGLDPLRLETVLRAGLPVDNPLTLLGFAKGGGVARFYRCTNPAPEWKGKGVPPPSWDPPYHCGPRVLRDVPLAPGPKPKQWSVDLHLPPSALPNPLLGPGGELWFSQYGPMGPEPGAKAGPIFVEYDADTGKRLRTVADPSSVAPAPQPLAGGAMLDAAALGLPGRRRWGSRLVLYRPGDARALRGAFFAGCNFTNFAVSADGQYAAGLCSALTRHMFLGIDFYGVSKSIAVFFHVPDLKVINVARLNKGFDGADAAVERRGVWLLEAIADNPGHIRILRVPLPQAPRGKGAGKPEGR